MIINSTHTNIYVMLNVSQHDKFICFYNFNKKHKLNSVYSI